MKQCLVLAMICLLVPLSLALADGDGPSRDMNPGERSAYKLVKKTVREATSAGPVNYTASFSGFDDRNQIFEGMKSDQMFRMAFAAQIQAWSAKGGGVPAMQEVAGGLPLKELNVRVQVNQDVRVGDKAKPYPLAGYPMAFEQSEGCLDSVSYCVSVLLGPFEKGKKAGESTLYTLRNTPLGVPTKPRGLMLVVSGPKEKPEKVKELLGKVDLKKLNSILP